MRGYTWLCASLLGCMSSWTSATEMNICVYDIMGANGDIMAVAKDYALAAKNWG